MPEAGVSATIVHSLQHCARTARKIATHCGIPQGMLYSAKDTSMSKNTGQKDTHSRSQETRQACRCTEAEKETSLFLNIFACVGICIVCPLCICTVCTVVLCKLSCTSLLGPSLCISVPMAYNTIVIIHCFLGDYSANVLIFSTALLFMIYCLCCTSFESAFQELPNDGSIKAIRTCIILIKIAQLAKCYYI